MKWQGRRQSGNIIDIRNIQATSVNVRWGESGNIVIDTDGYISGSASGAHTLNISLIIPNPPTRFNEDWMPNMTTAQRNALRDVVSVAKSNSPTISVRQPSEIEDVVLAQFVQSVINNG